MTRRRIGLTLGVTAALLSAGLAPATADTAPAPAPQADAVLQDDFETDLGGWVPRADSSGTPTLALTTQDARSGEQSALLTDRTSQGSGVLHDLTGLVEDDARYDLSAWLRFGAGQPEDEVWLSMASTTGEETAYSTLATFTGVTADGWTQVQASFRAPAADAVSIYLETRYSGDNTSDLYLDDVVLAPREAPPVQDVLPVRDTLDMPFGVAIDNREITGQAAELLLQHADQITAENAMKPDGWYDADRTFAPNPQIAQLMDFAQENGLTVYGHVLVWHSQVPDWFFTDDAGDPLPADEAGREVLRERLETHIHDVAAYLHEGWGDFGGDNPITAWDVVNEVIDDSTQYEDGMRRSEWYRILGEEFVDLSFRYADEAFNDVYAADGADRPVSLYINDYSTENDGKRGRYQALVERLLERDVPLDGVGHQFHVNLQLPVAQLERAILDFADLPVTQAVTELDVPTGTPVTTANLLEQGQYYRDAFRIFRERSDQLSTVTVWGLTDGRSWRSGEGAPLLFDDDFQTKPAYVGAVGGELPVPPPTATVFGEDVALTDGPLPRTFERMPWLAVGEDDAASIQLRWSTDVLTVAVRSEDATADDGDAVTVVLDGVEHRVPRDGDADVPASTHERDGGWDAVVQVPLEGAASGVVAELDVRVDDGATTHRWAPDLPGVITLVEELSVLEIPAAAAAPQIDGEVDDVWSDAPVVTTGVAVEGITGANADVRTLWSEEGLHVLAEVSDASIDATSPNPWEQDSVEIFLDLGNTRSGSYGPADMQLRIGADGALSFGAGSESAQRERISTATALVDGGYVVEATIDLLDAGGAASVHGFDVQVNDATAGVRTSVRTWADPTGLGYASTARWGVADLLEPAVAPQPQPSRTSMSLTRPLVLGAMSSQADVRVSSDGDVGGGLVQLYVNGRAAGAATPVGDDGRVRIPVPAPRTGIYLVQARFLGSDGAEASSSGHRLLVALRF